MDFNSYWTLIGGEVNFADRKAAAEKVWNLCAPEKQQAIIHWLQTHGRYPGRNPYFFILDFKMKQKQPKNLNLTNKGGKMLESGKAEIALYNGAWGVYSQEDIKEFKLLTKKEYDKQEQLKQMMA